MMADVSGPVSTLPGAHRKVPEGATCDDCGQPATRRMQGETDSFGCEWADLCDDCHAKARAYVNQGACDWCKTDAERAPMRDPDEGMYGPVYYVCSPCRTKVHDELAAEADAWGLDEW